MINGINREILRAIIMVFIITGIGILYNLIYPEGINPFAAYHAPGEILRNDPRTIISVEEIYEIWQSGQAIFIDTRPYSNYVKGHIAGAFSLPYDNMSGAFNQLYAILDPSIRIVAYCDGDECLSSLHVADFLQQNGFGHVNIFFGGWELWEIKDFPSEVGEGVKF